MNFKEKPGHFKKSKDFVKKNKEFPREARNTAFVVSISPSIKNIDH